VGYPHRDFYGKFALIDPLSDEA